MKVIPVFIIVFILCSPAILRADEVKLTLDEAIALALRDNPDILLKVEDVRKAQAKLKESESGLLPALSFTAGLTDTRGLYLKDSTNVSGQISLKQILYKGGKIVNTIKQSRYGLEVTQALLDKMKLEQVLSVKKAFYTFLLSKEFTVLNKSIMENTREHLDSINKRYRSGESSESTVLMIESSLSSVTEVLESSLNQVESAQALLNNLLNLDKGVKIIADAKIDYEAREVAFDEAFLTALKARPEIRQYEAQAEANKKAIEIAKAESRPTVSASWDYYSRSTALSVSTASPARGWNDYNVIGLTFTWPIFDGWATKAKVEQAIVDLKEAQILNAKAKSDIALELKNAYLSLKNAISRLRVFETEIKVYSDNLKSVKEKYKQGIASSLDFNDANLQYDISVFNKKLATFDYVIAKAIFDKATGGGI